MARPSKLTIKQLSEVEKRHLNGESIRSLAKEFKIAESSLRERISAQAKQIKHVANQIIETEQKIKALPITAQISVFNLADQLRSISMHLGSAANYGAMTAHKLSGLANAKAQLLDESVDVDSDEGLAKLRGIAALTRLSNDSAQIGVDLLKANKEAVEGLNKENDNPEPKQIVFTVTDASA